MKKKINPLISVIVPFHDDSIMKLLVSLSKCSEKEKCELILVSDGIDASALKYLDNFHASLNIKLIISAKCGKIGHLRNLGIQHSVTDYFYFIDSDCDLEKDALSRVIALKHKSDIIKGRNIFIGRNWISRLDAQLRDERYTKNSNYAYCPNLAINCRVFGELGLFNAQYTYGSDGEFAKRISEKGIEVRYDREIILYHDCTDSFVGVFQKWMRYGEARYYRYQNVHISNKHSTYFPNLYNLNRGVAFNCIAFLCNIGRAFGMIRAIFKKKVT